MPHLNGTFKIVVKGNKIISVEKDGKPMNETNAHAPKPNFGKDYPPPEAKLKDGCVGLGWAFEPEGREQCRWLWGKWW